MIKDQIVSQAEEYLQNLINDRKQTELELIRLKSKNAKSNLKNKSKNRSNKNESSNFTDRKESTNDSRLSPSNDRNDETNEKNNFSEVETNRAYNQAGNAKRIQNVSKRLAQVNERITYYEKAFPDLIDTIRNLLLNPELYIRSVTTIGVINNESDRRRSDEISYLARVYPESILAISKSYVQSNPAKFEWIEQFYDDRIYGLDEVPTNAFNYSEDLGKVVNNKFRYMFNMKFDKVIDYVTMDNAMKKEIMNTTQDYAMLKVTSPEANLMYNAKMFLQISNQSRWGNLWLQILSSFLHVDKETEAYALRNTYIDANSNERIFGDYASIQIIMYILSKMNSLPFYIFKNGMVSVNRNFSDKFGTSMVPFLYSMLELSKEEKGCNINHELAQIMIKYRFFNSFESLEQSTLDKKGIYSKMLKYITMNVPKTVKINYTSDFSSHVLVADTYNEYFRTDEERAKLIDVINEKADPDFKRYIDKYISIINNKNDSDAERNTETVRYLMMACLTFGNIGIYYRTSLVLEAVASVEPKVLQYLKYPVPKSYVELNGIKIPKEYDYDSGSDIFRFVKNEYTKRISNLKYIFSSTDFEQWYVSLLTNRSQGDKVEITDMLDLSTDDERNGLLLSVTQARLAAFLLDVKTYYDIDKVIEKLKTNGVCTTRFQNNRRARIVEIVPNIDQLAYAIVLRVFEEMKKHFDDMAVGKQLGGVTDMSLQLYISGSPNGVSIFSDVSAMDASTQPYIGVMFPLMIAEFLDSEILSSTKNYFAFKPNHPIHTVESQQMINPLSTCLRIVTSQRLLKKYLLKDNVFNTTIEINPSFFESGRFDTSAQHTTLLSIVSDYVVDIIKQKYNSIPVEFYKRKFGDDSYDAMILSSIDYDKTLVNEYIEITEKVLKQVGFDIETEYSSNYGDFLQQMAYNGLVVPKSARSSIYCDERGTTASRDIISQMSVLGSVLFAACQRLYSPVNGHTILNSMWTVSRTLRIGEDQFKSISASHLDTMVEVKHGRHFLVFKPYTINLPPFNFPNSNIQIDGVNLTETSELFTNGMSKFVFIQNQLITNDEKDDLIRYRDVDNFTKVGYVDPYDILKKKTIFNEFEKVIYLNYFNRNALLSEKRETLLSDDILYMSKNLSQYYDQNAIFKSNLAYNALYETYGVKVPQNLVYAYAPREKVTSLFAAKTESIVDTELLDGKFMSYVTKYNKLGNESIRERIHQTCFLFSSKYNKNNVLNTNINLGILPGYMKGSNYCSYNLLGRQQFRIKELIPSTTKTNNLDLERIINVGARIYAKGSHALGLYFQALNLSPGLTNELSSLITSGTVGVFSFDYTSGFQRDALFAVNSSVNDYNYLVKHSVFTTRAFKNVMDNIFRDYLMMVINQKYAHEFNMYPSYITFLKYNKPSIYRKLGASVLVA
uniref:RNA-dependent RNA polymerase n=1 Tax=Hubei odonate virus 14 TaxID=1922995 RepID=A0A1L3KP45_9VIRU|nr:RNA-dependent RNA polymerase [Hubei odonate virus 14]